jgi:hypothetical protein
MMRTHADLISRLGRLVILTAMVAVPTVAPAATAKAKPPLTFASPDEAAQTFVAALKAGDKKAMLEILGPEAGDLVDSGDAVADRASWDKFVTAYEEGHVFVKNGDQTILEIGNDKWPSPIPLVEKDGRWHFDTAAGEQEIIDRRIGRNELAAMQVLLAYVDAQYEYQQRNPQKAKIAPYARTVASTPGKQDGLYWPTREGEPESPFGEEVARARGEGYREAGKGGGIPFHGYYYRVLTSQGPDAKDGAYDYVVRGQMIGGFALVAFPADWDNSGVMTFIVNHDGVIYEKDLGPDTAKLAKAMQQFNPDPTWKEVMPATAEALASPE